MGKPENCKLKAKLLWNTQKKGLKTPKIPTFSQNYCVTCEKNGLKTPKIVI